MQVQSMFFKKRAAEKLGDELLQGNMRKAKGKFVDGRAKAVAEFGVWEEVRAHAAKVRDRALANLDAYLVEFEANATRRGAVVHWAETAEEACAIVAGIARDNGERKAAKSKSMVSEEVNLNEALEAAGVEVIETDLGEYILQLAHEPPSHIVAPAVHKSKEQVAELFVKAHGKPRLTEIPAMTREAREALRGHDCEPLAERVMTGSHAQTEGDEAELHAELRGLLDRMLIEEFKRQQQELVPRVTRDPAALAQYQALEQRLKGLLGISPRPT